MSNTQLHATSGSFYLFERNLERTLNTELIAYIVSKRYTEEVQKIGNNKRQISS